MSKKKLLEKLQKFFDATQHEKRKHRQEIKKVLKKFKQKERKIQQKLELTVAAEAIAELQQELKVIYAQRSKGVKVIKDMGS